MGKCLLGHFIGKHELSSEVDMPTTFDFLSFDTLNNACLAWFEEKDDIEQAKIEKKELNMN